MPYHRAMRVSDFLIIGAMKSGTTTLYHDLERVGAIFLPRFKEPNSLASDAVLRPRGRERYAELFAEARPEQRCGEASVRYSQLPGHPRCAERARAVCGPHLRVIYLVREPLGRALSQHHHALAHGNAQAEADVALRRHDKFLDYSRYAMQIEPWLEAFGPQQVLALRFEDFIADREAIVRRVCEFLDVEAGELRLETARAWNRAEDRREQRGPGARLLGSEFYRKRVRPRISRGLDTRLRLLLLPRSQAQPILPSPQTIRWMAGELRGDVERFSRLIGAPAPLWDVDAEAERLIARLHGPAIEPAPAPSPAAAPSA